MNKKSLWAVVGLVVIIAALAAAVYYKGSMPAPTAPAATSNETPAQANPNAPGMPVFGALVSSTASSVTIKTQDGSSRTFSLNASTSVVSTVQAGQVAGDLSSIKAGAQLTVVSAKTDSTVAAIIEPLPTPNLPATVPAGSTLVNVTGAVASHSATSLVVTNQSTNAPVTIAVTKNTQILSNVSAGKAGKGLSYITDGTVGVSVTALKTGSTYTALTVQILVPIN